jgi:hypothetical protein
MRLATARTTRPIKVAAFIIGMCAVRFAQEKHGEWLVLFAGLAKPERFDLGVVGALDCLP